MALGPKWVAAAGFSEGLAGVCAEGGECGYIAKTGKYVWRPTN